MLAVAFVAAFGKAADNYCPQDGDLGVHHKNCMYIIQHIEPAKRHVCALPPNQLVCEQYSCEN
jgi:hypothetical protein